MAGLVLASLILAFGNVNYYNQGAGYRFTIWVAVVATVYALVANGMYIFSGFKGKLKQAGGAISHIGFAALLLGILISSSKKKCFLTIPREYLCSSVRIARKNQERTLHW